jgi:hypothetical protein
MMKIKLLLTACMVVLLTTLNAQFTLRVAGGYSGPGIMNTESVLGPSIDPGTPTVDGLANMANRNDSAHTYKPVHGSYGTGGNVNIGLGYMFNRFIGFDVAFGYAHSNNIGCTEVVSFAPQPITGFLTANLSSYSWALAVAPSIVISAEKKGWKVYPYSRIGIALPVAGKLVDNVTINSPYALNVNGFGWIGNRTDVTMVTTATVSLGINGVIGVAYRPVPYLNIFAELTGQYLNVRGKSSTITKWDATIDSAGTSHKVNDVPLRGVYRNQFNYVDQLTSTSNNAQYNSSYNPNQPKQDIRPVVPGSSLGFNVGITLFLSKKTLKKDAAKPTPKS